MKSSDLYGIHSSLIYDNFVYSIDMLRIKTKITSDFFERKIRSRIAILQNSEYYTTSQMGKFRDNYIIHIDEDISFWLGYISNSELYAGSGGVNNPKYRANLTIEFNPNKIRDNKFINYLLSLSFEDNVQQPIIWDVVSCDFACDIPENILNIGGINKGRKSFIKTIDNGKDDKTFYIGKGANRIKIYNKRIESNLDDKDLTRVELTHEFPSNTSVSSLFHYKDIKITVLPKLYKKEYQLCIEDLDCNSTMKALLYAVNNGYPLHDLDFYYRKKILDYESKKEPISISSLAFTNVLKQTLMYYFLTPRK